ncbi:hypothetical protein E1B28_005492 [Marasmius oreades]|uniref:Arb2-like domain-containing protein n=1 Tax=Marasmius oreades TaxID=181124 RepID=A0A9P7S3Z8_9AGAR|nr:uncharacterized protein E1B28_005492 [Marasmius oreades]KAG7094672.1 hypothetical protein E1B28_005492 [Marasmius oreades]
MELNTSAAICDVNLEKSYLLDFSKEMVAWVKSEGYSLLDINLFPKPTLAVTTSKRSKSTPDIGKQVATYLWDNYIQYDSLFRKSWGVMDNFLPDNRLSSARRIILIGHGPGGQAIMDLLENRTMSVTNTVRAVIQVVGHDKVPIVPKYSDELRVWYTQHSYVVLPSRHRVLGPETRPRDLKRHGHLSPIEENKPIKMIMRALPGIREYVKTVLEDS